MDRGSKTALGVVLLTAVLLVPAAEATPEVGRGGRPWRDGPPGRGGGPPPLSNTVGIRLTVSNLDSKMLLADLDLTMYTRGAGPYTTTTGGAYVGVAGYPYLGYPAIEFGDGATVAYTTLALTNTGGGPGGSNVYRSLASFSHNYPGLGPFNARAAMICTPCFQFSLAFFPVGSPVPPTFTTMVDYRPTSVIGNLPLRLTYTGTGPTYFGTYSVRYDVASYPVVTNAATILFEPAIPTASEWGLAALGAALLAAGLVLMRRRA